MFSGMNGDVVFWDVEVSYMHLRVEVQSFELLQGLIGKDIILIDPLVLRVRVPLPFDQILQFVSSAKSLRV